MEGPHDSRSCRSAKEGPRFFRSRAFRPWTWWGSSGIFSRRCSAFCDGTSCFSYFSFLAFACARWFVFFRWPLGIWPFWHRRCLHLKDFLTYSQKPQERAWMKWCFLVTCCRWRRASIEGPNLKELKFSAFLSYLLLDSQYNTLYHWVIKALISCTQSFNAFLFLFSFSNIMIMSLFTPCLYWWSQSAVWHRTFSQRLNCHNIFFSQNSG